MTSVDQQAGEATGQSATCAFPGCGRPVRPRAGDGVGGKPPIYCDLTNPATGKWAHTPLTAARERAKQRNGAADGDRAPDAGETPASGARERAASLLEQFQAAAGQMSTTLQQAVEALQAAGDPDSVSAELTAARRHRERVQWDADERITAAETARDTAEEDAAAARTEASEARAARDEAITELDSSEAQLAQVREQLETARAEHAEQLEHIRAETATEINRLSAEAEQRVRDVEAHAAEQVAAAQREAARQVTDAEQARDRAAADAAAQRQAAGDAAQARDELRAELKQLRADHRDELAALRKEHRAELHDERQRADTALTNARTEHRREIDAFQHALAALRATGGQHADDTPPELAEPRPAEEPPAPAAKKGTRR